MTLRTSLNDFKRARGAARSFPGELRSTAGRFSGLDDRLVHVRPDGSLRDYSYPLCGLAGIDRSRFGVAVDGTTWFTGGDQRYHGDSAVVKTVHDQGDWAVVQHDLTVGRAHVTRFELQGSAPADVSLRAFVGFAPDDREGQTSLLVHEDAVEAYHRREHDFAGVSTDLSSVEGQIPERFPELVADEPVAFPRRTDAECYEDEVMTGGAVLTAPFADGGVTLVTLLTEDGDRAAALDRVAELAATHDGPDPLLAAGADQADWTVPDSVPERDAVVDDLRVLSLLSAANGARIAGPDFDPFYTNSGGYGYTWYRDDAEIARFLLTGGDRLDLDLDDWHHRSAAFHCRTQRPDGSWPHRVWPGDERLAPGWANAKVERGEGADYQADQTASVLGYLGTYLRERDPDEPARVRAAVEAGVGSLDGTLADDGLPVPCQNAWEDMQGRFVHTAATFLHAYGAVARAPVDDDLQRHAREQIELVRSGLDRLWTGDRFALREHDGELDPRLDSGSLALPAAVRESAAVVDLDDRTRERLVTHVETTLDGLSRSTDAIDGLVRYEGDDWRTADQPNEKVWTVATAWGANAAAELGTLLAEADDPRATDAYARSRGLLRELLADGSLVQETGYLPEQLFDDGTPDSATPLGWPHALRLATVAHLDAAGELTARVEAGAAE